jgi:hypothetical protein
MPQKQPYQTVSKVPTSLRLHDKVRQGLTRLAELTGVSVQDHVRLALSRYTINELSRLKREMDEERTDAA